jgi:hypothetical protein
MVPRAIDPLLKEVAMNTQNETAPEARADWPTDLRFEDDPAAIEEPRGQNGWNGAATAIDLTGKRFSKLLVIDRTAGSTR